MGGARLSSATEQPSCDAEPKGSGQSRERRVKAEETEGDGDGCDGAYECASKTGDSLRLYALFFPFREWTPTSAGPKTRRV